MTRANARVIFQRNLQHYTSLRKLSQQDVANSLQITPSTVSDWFLGKKYPRVDTMQRLADLLDIPMSYLTGDSSERPQRTIPTGFEDIPHMHRVPLLGSIACGTPITAEENVEDYVNVPVDFNCNFVLRCKGDSMAPRVMDGDLVYIRQQPDVEDGQIAAVIIDGEATLKHVYHIPGGVQLVSDNPAYRPLMYTGNNCDELRIVGLAVAYQRML